MYFKTNSTFARFLLIAAVMMINTLLGRSASVFAQGKSCPGGPPSRLVVSRDAYIPPGTPNNLRATPSKTAAVLVQVPGDSYVPVMEGPQCADNLAWWKVEYASQTGWMAEGSGSDYYMAPTTSPITEFTGQDAEIQFKNVSFTYNGVFGQKVQAVIVFAMNPASDTPVTATPQYIEFTFQDGKPEDLYRQPVLQIYPVSDYQKIADIAKTRIATLQSLLKKKPDKPSGEIPVLPPVPAGQVFNSNIAYFDFDDGNGVRFFTSYAQDVAPITSDRLLYVFQGLTSDGKYLVSASFPVSTALLADKREDDKDFAAIDMSSQNAGDQYQAYLNDTIAKLNNADPSDFKPNLDDLDALVQAVTVK